MSRILVVGAGYAGVTAANRLARDTENEVALVNERPTFVHRVRLHQLAAGSVTSVSRPLSTMLHPRIEVVVDRVAGLTPGHVRTESGRELAADHIALALGSGAGGGIAALEGAQAIRSQVAGFGTGARLAVLGAGLTGVEVAAEFAEARPELHVSLHDPAGLLPRLPDQHRAAACRALTRLGVTVETGEPGQADAVIDCRGLAVPSLARDCGLDVDQWGRVRVAHDLSVPGRPGLWAVGDCAAVEGLPWVRMSCAAALPMGAHLADSLARAAAGQPTRPVDFGYVLQCLSLGRRQGLLLRVDRQDRPTGLLVAGRAGAKAKEFICWYAGDLPRWSGQGGLWGKVAA